MKASRYIAVALLVAAAPAWAAYQCTNGGETSFQDTPCADAKSQKEIQLEDNGTGTGSNSAGGESSVQRMEASNAQLESERLRHETEYALRDKQEELDNFRAHCSAIVNEAANRRFTEYDARTKTLRDQSDAIAAAQARAIDCNTQVQVLQGEIEDLRQRCTAQNCTPL